ncbi:MAG: ACP S-malonyltransferase [Candidatus Omnitrophica bacterium]|nr:ACP S-malonyltransferase [Candidatus Omnitrophota bacterium]
MNAMIFPGQGAQYAGMGKSLYDSFEKARGVFTAIDEVLGFKISDICFGGSEEELKNTRNQQLAILTVSLAAFEVFKDTSALDITYFSGLSLGEYTCLYAAGVLALSEVARLVNVRAQAMEDAAKLNPSTMLAVIGWNREQLVAKEGLGFYVANINALTQIAVSVSAQKKAEVAEALTKEGAKVIELAVSGGFHSPFMAQAKAPLAEIIGSLDFQDAKIPIVSNVTAKAHTNAEEIKQNLVTQMVSPVLWNGCVNFMAQTGVDTFVETGPSRVLRGLMRKINSQLKVINIEKKEDIENLTIS